MSGRITQVIQNNSNYFHSLSMADDSSCKRQRKARMQLSAVEKTEIRKSYKRGSSQTEKDRVVSEWNEKHPDRKIDSGHVKRLRDDLPAFENADAFWQSVETDVSSKTRQVNA